MRARSLLLVAPALALALMPPACAGTESGNPRCAPPPCPIQLGDWQTRGTISTDRSTPPIRLHNCGWAVGGEIRWELSVEGEIRWALSDAERTDDGALRVTLRGATGPEEATWIVAEGQRWRAVGGELTITPDASVSGALDLRQELGPDAGTPRSRWVPVEGELDVLCSDGEPGVPVVTGAGETVVIGCHETWSRTPPPCDDTPSGC